MKQKNKIIKFKIIAIIIIWFLIILFLVQSTFLYFSDRIFKSYIKDKVYEMSDGLYSADFESVKIDLLRRNLQFININLKPDTVVYQNLISQNNFEKPIYEISLDTFIVKKIRVFDLIKKSRTLNVNEIDFISPKVKLITISKINENFQRKNEYEVAKKDLIPFMLKFFYSLQIDRIILKNGFFDFLENQKIKNETFSAKNITLILNYFDINRENYQTKQDLLYTENVELQIEGYKLNLKDKIHVLEASNVNISSKYKSISLQEAYLSPSQLDTFSLDTISENYFEIIIPEINLQNADFERLYVDLQIDLKNIEIPNSTIKLFKKKSKKDTTKTKVNLYKLIEGNLEYIKIDTFILKNAQLFVYDNVKDKKSRTEIENFTLEFDNFNISEQTVDSQDRILGAENVSLNLGNFSHKLKDNVHTLNAMNLQIDSKDQTIIAKNLSLLPENNIFSNILYQNINKVNVPEIEITGVNIYKFYNENILEIENFTISNPILYFISQNNKEKKTFKGGDNFQNNLSSLTKDYLKTIKIQNFSLNYGTFSIKSTKKDKQTSTSGNLTLTFNQFSFNPHQSVSKLFAAENVDILFTNYKLNVEGSFHVLSIDKFQISTYREGLFLENIKIKSLDDKNIIADMQAENKSILLDLEIPELQILETNIHKSLMQDSLKISNIDIPNAMIDLTIIDDNQKKSDKLKNIVKLKNKAIKNISKKSSENKIEIYLHFNKLDSSNLAFINKKQSIIDSIENFAVSSINSMIINAKHVDSFDTIYQPIFDIQTTACNSIEYISSKDISDYQIDSTFIFTLNKIAYVNNSLEKNVIEKEEIYELVGSFLNIIDIDKVKLQEGEFVFNKINNETKTELFRNTFSIEMFDFYFNYDSILTEQRFLFSKDIDVKLQNYVLNLKDNVHKLVIKEIELSTEKSEIVLNSVSVSPFVTEIYNKSNKIYAFCPKTVISNIDMTKLYEEQQLEIESLIFTKPLISILKDNSKVKDTLNQSKLTQVLLPSSIKTLNINNMTVNNGKIKLLDVNNSNEKVVFQSDFNFNINNFLIDSVTFVANNPLLIPIEKINFSFSNFKFNLKDSIHSIAAEEITFISETSTLNAKNFNLKYNKNDSLLMLKLKTQKKSNLIDILFPEIVLENINLKEVINDKKLLFSTLTSTSPVFLIDNYQYLKIPTNEKQKIANLDLYKFIKPIFTKFQVEKVQFVDAKFGFYRHKIDTVDTIYFENISGKITNVLIDSASKNDETKFLSSEDIALKINNISKVLKDSLYTIKAGELGISTKKSKISVTNFSLKPNYDKKIFSEEILGYQKAVTDIEGKHIDFINVDIDRLIEKKEFLAERVNAEGFVFDFYKDMNPIFNDTLNPKHPMDLLRNAKRFIRIDTLFLLNSSLIFEQLAESKTQTGRIDLQQINGYILNITNDSSIIKNEKSLLADFYAKLMGSGNMHININLPLNSKDNYHEIEGSLENMNVADFNDFVSKSLSASISEGIIDEMNFKIKGNDSISTCLVKLKYHGIEVNVWSSDTTEEIKRRNFVSFVINKVLTLKNNFQRENGFQKGDIVYTHDNSRQFLYNWLQPLIKSITAAIVGNETANMVENFMAKARIKKQRRKEEKKLQKLEKQQIE